MMRALGDVRRDSTLRAGHERASAPALLSHSSPVGLSLSSSSLPAASTSATSLNASTAGVSAAVPTFAALERDVLGDGSGQVRTTARRRSPPFGR